MFEVKEASFIFLLEEIGLVSDFSVFLRVLSLKFGSGSCRNMEFFFCFF